MTRTRSAARRLAASVVTATALASGLAVGFAPSASAQTESYATPHTTGDFVTMGGCGQTFNPSVSGGRAYWEVQCYAGRVRISGWVEDTRADGRCAKVKAIYPNSSTWFSAAACPKGEREPFTSPYRNGYSVNAYLYTYQVD